jgi:hypothetical protein
MPDPIWFYAQNDVQKDPVSASSLWAMARSGQLQPHDLVWKEGMEDWVAAGEIRGLFVQDKDTDGDDGVAVAAGAKPAEKTAGKDSGRTLEKPAERPAKSPDPSAPDAKPATAPAARSPSAPGPSTPAPSTTPPPAAAPARRPESGGRWAMELPATGAAPLAPALASGARQAQRTRASQAESRRLVVRRLAAVVVVASLTLLVGARGCDRMSQRNAERLAALADRAETQFQDEWDQERAEIDAQQDAVRARGTLTSADQSQLQFLIDQGARLDTAKTRERDALRAGEWKKLKRASSEAASAMKVNGYYREGVFLLALLALVASLATVAAVSQGADRYASIAFLAAIALGVLLAT